MNLKSIGIFVKKVEEYRVFGLRLRTMWDIFMVTIALINVILILFDFTYIKFRPYYYQYFPEIVKKYDPIKGIEPHRFSEKYLKLVDELDSLSRLSVIPDSVLQKYGEELFQLSVKMLKEIPFKRANLIGQQEIIKRKIKKFIREKYHITGELHSTQAFQLFWTDINKSNIRERIEYFNKEVRFHFAINYWRHYDIDGDFVDRFNEIDFPFLIFFWLEFLIRWFLQVQTGEIKSWQLYPIIYWYDLLGLLPVKSLRFFRLFRIVSVYYRLKRTQFVAIENNIISNFLRKHAQLIAEILSERIAYDILEKTKQDIREGTGTEELALVLKDVEEDLSKLIIIETAGAMKSLRNSEEFKDFLDFLITSFLEVSLSKLPLPAFTKRRALQTIKTEAIKNILKNMKELEDTNNKQLQNLSKFIVKYINERVADPSNKDLLMKINIKFIERLQERIEKKNK